MSRSVRVLSDATQSGITARSYGDRILVLISRNGTGAAFEGPVAEELIQLIPELGSGWNGSVAAALAEIAQARSSSDELVRLARVLGTLHASAREGGLAAQTGITVNDLLTQAPSLLRYAQNTRTPLYAMVEMTYVCNLRCQHCYVLHKIEEKHPARLDKKSIYDTISDLTELGALSVTVTGGEPTLAPEFQSVVTTCKDRGLLVVLKTNATTFNRDRATRYAVDPATETHVSLYAATADLHDEFTCSRGSFKRTVAGLSNLADQGIRCRVNCTVWRRNVDELHAMKALVENLGHYLVVDDTIWGRHNGDTSPRQLALTRDQRDRLLSEGVIKPFSPSPCTAGAVKVKVDAEGGVSTCELLPVSFGNVHQRSLSDIWESPELSGYGRETISISNKRREEGNLALACPGLNLLATGTRRG